MTANRASRAVLALLVLSAVVAFAPIEGFPLDDAWIHQVVARTFAESGTLGYAPDAPGAAATSLLWAIVNAVNHRFIHAEPVVFVFALNVIGLLASADLLFGILVRARPEGIDERGWTVAAFGAAVAGAASPNFLWFAHSGMEATWLVALSLAAIATVTRARTTKHAAIAGALSGLCALLRPDGMLLGLLLAAYVLRSAREDRWRLALSAAIPHGVAVAVCLSFSWVSTGHLLPTTLAGRTWLWLDPARELSRFDLVLAFADAWAHRLRTYTVSGSTIVFLCLLAVALHGALRLWRSKNDGIRLLFVFALLHVALYAIVLPTPANGGRYQPEVPFLFAACLLLGSFFAMTNVVAFVRGQAWHVRALALIAIVAQLGPMIPAMRRLQRAHRLAVAHTNETELGAGRFLATLPRDTKVASFDIGGIGFASRRPILDLGGLSHRSVATMLENGTIVDHLRRERIEIVVLPENDRGFEDLGMRLRLHDNAAVALEQIFVAETPFDAWHPAVIATENSARRQVAYRIAFPRAPSTTPIVARRGGQVGEEPSFLVPKLIAVVAVLAMLELLLRRSRTEHVGDVFDGAPDRTEAG